MRFHFRKIPFQVLFAYKWFYMVLSHIPTYVNVNLYPILMKRWVQVKTVYNGTLGQIHGCPHSLISQVIHTVTVIKWCGASNL